MAERFLNIDHERVLKLADQVAVLPGQSSAGRFCRMRRSA